MLERGDIHDSNLKMDSETYKGLLHGMLHILSTVTIEPN